jgi:hypothetical protein
VGLALAVAVAVVGGLSRWRLWGDVRPLAVAGGVGLLIAALTSLPGGEHLAEWIVTDVPGGGIIRDSQKFVAPLAVFWAVATGCVVDEMVGHGAAPRWTQPVGSIVAVALALVPVAVLPDAPASVGGRLQSVAIPPSFLDARDHLDEAAPGGVAVFPWTLYRRTTTTSRSTRGTGCSTAACWSTTTWAWRRGSCGARTRTPQRSGQRCVAAGATCAAP